MREARNPSASDALPFEGENMIGDDDNQAQGTVSSGAHPASPDDAALPRDVQEHLGRQLRSALRNPSEKPAYLGDPGTPSQFDRLIAKMETGERIHERAVQAVEKALDDLVSPPAGRPGDPPD